MCCFWRERLKLYATRAPCAGNVPARCGEFIGNVLSLHIRAVVKSANVSFSGKKIESGKYARKDVRFSEVLSLAISCMKLNDVNDSLLGRICVQTNTRELSPPQVYTSV